MKPRVVIGIVLLGTWLLPAGVFGGRYIGRGSANVTAPGDAKKTAVDEALQDAVRRAIEKRLGPDAVLENEGTLEDNILTAAREYVLRWEEKDSRQRGTRLRVTIEAEVDDERLGRALTNLRLLQAAVDMPRLMIVYDPQQTWDPEQSLRVENQLVKHFTERKFNVFETQRAREISALAQRALQFAEFSERKPMPGDEFAQNLMAQYECDAVVLYSVQESLQGMMADFHTYETAVQARVYTRDRAQYLAADEKSAAKPGGTAYQSKLASAEAASKQVVDYMAGRIVSWWRDFRDLMPINLNLYLHRAHLRRIVQLKQRIEGIVGVHSVNQRRIVTNPQDDSTWVEYQVNYRGRVDAFTVALWEALEPEEREFKLLPMTFGNNVTVQIIDPQQQQVDEAFWQKKLSERAALEGGDIARVVDETVNGAVLVQTFMDVPPDFGEKEEEKLVQDDEDDAVPEGEGKAEDAKEEQKDTDKKDQPDAKADSKDTKDTKAATQESSGRRIKVRTETEVEIEGLSREGSGAKGKQKDKEKEGTTGQQAAQTGDEDKKAEDDEKPAADRKRTGPKTRVLANGGSGFIVDPAGLIVTNHHVVQRKLEGFASGEDSVPPEDVQVVVTLRDGRKRAARVLRADAARDLALLQIEGDGFQPLELGDSDRVVVGQRVVVISNPLESPDFDFTVTSGIIAARRPGWLQTTALIHPGSSGGPVLDMKGRVIGVVTRGRRVFGKDAEEQPEAIVQQGTGLCVPVNDVKILLRSP